jgi:HEPN domain-containing protein
MTTPRTYIGRFEHHLRDVAAEYQTLAQEDEQVGTLLIGRQQYRHGVYFLVQAMEKYVRSTIFGLVNPNTAYFRERTRTHDLDALLAFLVEIASADPVVQDQVRRQIEQHVLGTIRFGNLHNNLRYPAYLDRRQSYALLRVGCEDAKVVSGRLQTLKRFLGEIHQLQR